MKSVTSITGERLHLGVRSVNGRTASTDTNAVQDMAKGQAWSDWIIIQFAPSVCHRTAHSIVEEIRGGQNVTAADGNCIRREIKRRSRICAGDYLQTEQSGTALAVHIPETATSVKVTLRRQATVFGYTPCEYRIDVVNFTLCHCPEKLTPR